MSDQTETKGRQAPPGYPTLTNCRIWAEDRAAASAAGKKGGAASGRTKRKRRLLRDAARDLLDKSVDGLPEAADLLLALRALGCEEPTGADALMLAQFIRAARGDTEAARFVRDTGGERPAQELAVSAADRPIDADAVRDMTDDELAALAAAEDAPSLPDAAPAARLPAANAPDAQSDVAPAVAPAEG